MTSGPAHDLSSFILAVNTPSPVQFSPTTSSIGRLLEDLRTSTGSVLHYFCRQLLLKSCPTHAYTPKTRYRIITGILVVDMVDRHPARLLSPVSDSRCSPSLLEICHWAFRHLTHVLSHVTLCIRLYYETATKYNRLFLIIHSY